jgi:hypothetical protein
MRRPVSTAPDDDDDDGVAGSDEAEGLAVSADSGALVSDIARSSGEEPQSRTRHSAGDDLMRGGGGFASTGASVNAADADA